MQLKNAKIGQLWAKSKNNQKRCKAPNLSFLKNRHDFANLVSTDATIELISEKWIHTCLDFFFCMIGKVTILQSKCDINRNKMIFKWLSAVVSRKNWPFVVFLMIRSSVSLIFRVNFSEQNLIEWVYSILLEALHSWQHINEYKVLHTSVMNEFLTS